MTPEDFHHSLNTSAPPAGLRPALAALWWAAKGDWRQVHEIVMSHEDDHDCAWVHAYLHRVEGDLPNAAWWYGQAKRPVAVTELEAEWRGIATALLAGLR